LKLCPGPCFSSITKEEYLENVKKIELFLKGETIQLKQQIEEKMNKASGVLNFELAAFWRDKLEDIDHATDRQHILMNHEANKDIVGFFNDKQYVAMVIIHIRESRILNNSSFTFDLREKLIKKNEVLSSILEQYYQDFRLKLPDIIIIPSIKEKLKILLEFLKDLKADIKIRTPTNENEVSLMRIANKNAKVMVKQLIQMEEFKMNDQEFRNEILEETKDLLNLPKLPKIIEGFDVSNIEGFDATGSMVYFLDGKPYNKYYRHFKIRSKSTPDDVAMMKEILRRRYKMLLERNFELPDLILVDGGKGQLNVGVSVLKEFNLDIPIIGLAKKYEEIFLPSQKEPIVLPKSSSVLKLFQRVRDEAHRFAIKLQKKQRKKSITGSILDEIQGVGPITRNKLLNHFGSIDKIKKASSTELSEIVGKKLAERILEELNK